MSNEAARLAFAARRRQYVDERISDLEETLAVLQATYDGSGYEGAKSLVAVLQGYPERLREKCREQEEDALDWRQEASGYVEISKQINALVARIDLLLTKTNHNEVPRPLIDAIVSEADVLGLGPRTPVIASDDPSRFETYLSTATPLLLGEARNLPEEDKFLFMIIPAWEARHSRWWPIPVGHELAHKKLEQVAKLGDNPIGDLNLAGSFPWGNESWKELEDRGMLVTELIRQPQVTGSAAEGLTSDPLERAVYAMATAWMTEVVCDAYMVMRFGSAGIAAMADFLWANGWESSESATHPSGEFRVECMLKVLEETREDGSVDSEVLDPWREEVDLWRTQEGGSVDEPINHIYSAISQLVPHVVLLVKSWITAPSTSVAAVRVAQRHLSLGVPPSQALGTEFPPGICETLETYEGNIPNYPQTGHSVLNAAWMVSVARRRANGLPLVPVDRLAEKAWDTLINYPPVMDASTFENSDAATQGVLTRPGILHRMQVTRPIWNRLIVSPFEQSSLGPGGLDLRLGSRFITFKRSGTQSLDPEDANAPFAIQQMVTRSAESPFVLHPSETVLASVIEYIAMPLDLSAQVITRSSFGRLGLITATAVQVHPMYRGCLTLELVNLGSMPIALRPGIAIAQLVFTVASPPLDEPDSEDLLSSSRYVCPIGPEFSRASSGH